MSLDLGELVGTLKMDISPFETALGRGDTALNSFSTSAKATAAATGESVSRGLSGPVEALARNLPRTAEGAVDKTSIEFQALSSAVKRAIADAEANVKFDALAPEMKSAINEAEAVVRAGLSDVTKAASDAGDEAGSRFSDEFKSNVKNAGAVAGALLGASLGAGVVDNLSVEAGLNKLTAQLGLSQGEMKIAGQVAGQVYANNFGEDLPQINVALASVVKNMNIEIGSVDLQPITEQVLTLVDVFDQDLAMSTAAIGQMIRTGLVKDAQEGLDVLTLGLQSPANKADDLAETMNEYGGQFQKLGINGATAMGLLSQGVQGGARDADIAADAFKEFSIRAIDGSELTVQGFQTLGLNAEKMAARIAAGGPTARAGLDQVLDKLRQVKDPAERAAVATALFGTQSEDLGNALTKMDVSSAAKGLGEVAGASQKAVDQMGSGGQATIDGYRRNLIQMGRDAIESTGPTAMLAGAVAAFGPAVLGIAGPVASMIAARAVQTAAAGTAATAETVASTSTVRAWLTAGAASVAGGVRIAGAWLLAGGVAVTTYLGSLAVAVMSTVAGWVVMGAQSLLQAARVAAAWLIALGPIGFVIAAVVGVGAIIYKNWDNIKRWTGAAWDWVVGKVKAVPDKLLAFFLNFTLPGLIFKHWDSIKSGASAAWGWLVDFVRGIPGKLLSFFLNFTLPGLVIKHFGALKEGAIEKATALITWVAGLPGRLLDKVGDLGGVLKDAGVDIVQGLIDGIMEKFEDLKDKVGEITGWIKDHKGPKAVDLALWRPAGNWIVTGLMLGLDDQMPALTKKVGDVTDTIRGVGALSAAVMAATPPPGLGMTGDTRPPQVGASTREGDTWTIYETSDAAGTAAEVSRRQAFAGAAG